jgi:hypothetical protein
MMFLWWTGERTIDILGVRGKDDVGQSFPLSCVWLRWFIQLLLSDIELFCFSTEWLHSTDHNSRGKWIPLCVLKKNIIHEHFHSCVRQKHRLQKYGLPMVSKFNGCINWQSVIFLRKSSECSAFCRSGRILTALFVFVVFTNDLIVITIITIIAATTRSKDRVVWDNNNHLYCCNLVIL